MAHMAPFNRVTMSRRVFVSREMVWAPLNMSLKMSALNGRQDERNEFINIIDPKDGAFDDFK